MLFVLVFFFFFKQKTAYEMRISDWSSDVCSSDLAWLRPRTLASMRDAIARPAASSFALLMRLPLDRRSMACDCMRLATRELFWARSALTLVLMTVMIFLSGPMAIPVVWAQRASRLQ